MEPVIDNSGAAAGAAQPAAGTATPAPAPAATLLGAQGAQTETAAGSLLGATGAQAPAPAAATPGAPAGNDWLPEKFRVLDGADINFTASAQKLGEAYSNLEKRFGAGEARPATADAYKIEQGETFNAAEFLAAPGVKEWMGKAHELGFNDKQLNFMIGEFISAQPTAAETVTGMTEAEARAELVKTWAKPEDFNRNMLAASAAAKGLLRDDYQPFLARYGNDPAIIKLLAAVGGEMSEDALRLAGTPIASAESIEDLMKNPAYRDEKHPDHKRVAAAVREYFRRTYPENPHS